MSETDRGSERHGCSADVAAYALGALHPDEAEAFRSHLETCVVCRDELAAFRSVVDVLPMSAPQHAVPKRLRRRVLAQVHREARLRPEHGRRRLTVFDRLPTRRPGLALAAVVAAVAIAIVGIELGSPGSATRVYAAHVTGSTGSAKVTITSDQAELVVRHFPPPPPGKIYEVWLARRGQAPAPTGALFSVSASGNSDVALPTNLHGVQTVMVTPEPAGGTRVPTHAPVIVAQLS